MSTIPNEVPLSVDHHKRAEAIIEMIRAEVETIEGFGHPQAGRRRTLTGVIGVITDVELEAAARACDADPELAAAARMTGRASHLGTDADAAPAHPLRRTGRWLLGS